MLRQVVIMSSMLFSLTYGQSSKELAEKGNMLWKGFECSELYRFLGDTIKGDTFLNIGFNEGRLFLKAIEDNKITKEDLYQVVPKSIEYILVGPSIDFVLGRIHMIVSETTIKEITKPDDKYVGEKQAIINAKKEIEQCGCKSLK